MSETERPPEGELIERLRVETRPQLSVRKAASAAGISEGRWRSIVKGTHQVTKGTAIPTRAPAATLARMAKVVGATPEQLVAMGRQDAADELVRQMTVRERARYERAGGVVSPSIPGLGEGLAGLIPTVPAVETGPPPDRDAFGEDPEGMIAFILAQRDYLLRKPAQLRTAEERQFLRTANAVFHGQDENWPGSKEATKAVQQLGQTVRSLLTVMISNAESNSVRTSLEALLGDLNHAERLLGPMLETPTVLAGYAQELQRISKTVSSLLGGDNVKRRQVDTWEDIEDQEQALDTAERAGFLQMAERVKAEPGKFGVQLRPESGSRAPKLDAASPTEEISAGARLDFVHGGSSPQRELDVEQDGDATTDPAIGSGGLLSAAERSLRDVIAQAGDAAEASEKRFSLDFSWSSTEMAEASSKLRELFQTLGEIDASLNLSSELDELHRSLAPVADTPIGMLAALTGEAALVSQARTRLEEITANNELQDMLKKLENHANRSVALLGARDAARSTPPDYRKGRGEHGDAGGEVDQDEADDDA